MGPVQVSTVPAPFGHVWYRPATYLFLFDHRLPLGMMRRGWQPWASTMGTNVAIAFAAATVIWLVGFKLFLIVQLPITVLGATVGVWLFFVQHQFEQTSWERLPEWKRQEAALHGSFALRFTGAATLVHREYWRTPCPSPMQAGSPSTGCKMC